MICEEIQAADWMADQGAERSASIRLDNCNLGNIHRRCDLSLAPSCFQATSLSKWHGSLNFGLTLSTAVCLASDAKRNTLPEQIRQETLCCIFSFIRLNYAGFTRLRPRDSVWWVSSVAPTLQLPDNPTVLLSTHDRLVFPSAFRVGANQKRAILSHDGSMKARPRVSMRRAHVLFSPKKNLPYKF